MLKIEEIKVNGFKSLADIDVSINKLNVLIGPNGSGKTNFLEFFLLLQKIIRPTKSPSYPFSRWGGYQNVCHKLNTDQIIEFEIKGKVNEHAFHYQAKINGMNESVTFLYEFLQVTDVCTIKRQYKEFVISYPQKLLDKLEQTKRTTLDEHENQLFQSLLDTGIQKTTIEDSRSIMDFIHSSQFGYDKDFAYGSLNGNMACISNVFVDPDGGGEPLFTSVMRSLNFYSVLSVKSICNVRISENYDQQYQLDEHGNGLIILLYNRFLQNNKRFPSIIENAMQTLFPGWELGFNLNQEGTITLNATYDTITYTSKSLPDGLLKMLFILTALYLKPTILLIDEIENSLHSGIIRYILQECSRCEDTIVFMTTHSPHIMDLCDLNDIILTERVRSSSSFSHVDNIEELTKQLLDTEMTFSDTYFDGNL